ncbi:MAG: hypothetical protein KDA58_14540 [Planctomycetaceae bacterium]|nr:hypothetical protein [Planctomycetaceae bacterium]
MTTYEFPTKEELATDAGTEAAPSTGRSVGSMLRYSLYGFVGLLAMGYIAVQANPNVAEYFAMIPGVAPEPAKSCSASAGHGCCHRELACASETSCSGKASCCASACHADEAELNIALPPAPPMPESLPIDGTVL